MMQASIRRLWVAARIAATALLLAVAALPAGAAGPKRPAAALGNPHLASMQVEIWPEYDRPAALVIMRAALAADATLPADVSLRIPASSGGPSAMAYSESAGGELLNLEYARSDANGYTTLRFKVPQRYFHVEFYDPLPAGPAQRNFTYTWPGDFGTNRLAVVVQEPAAASGFSVTPSISTANTGQDGLRYHAIDLGARTAGKSLPITVTYSKSDARTSAEILASRSGAATATTGTGVSAPQTNTDENASRNVLIIVLVASLLVAGITAFMWWRGRGQAPAPRARAKAACPKCGAAHAADDRYCAKCGTSLKAKA